MKVTTLEREFVFDGHPLPDPSPNLSVEQVREMYCQKTPAGQFHPKSM